ncbi:MAG: UDP-N-acetylmuramoyl-L-alanyl-D-glutamate--2,6-diaminopimelate ligase [Omnitrophica bacterium RIFCSPLOWO2_12_FULL_50_11]|nr:MAG: UDP-N-acetylmuramoyl-L-alanyl-D-glutamate--2,6-diaminopimelate ligase [Omnitrophica bacterium RIFCSPLOWO2_12_FULL_50_11]
MKTLRQLLEGISYLSSQKGELEVAVTGVSCDTRTLERGNLFVAVSGMDRDGHVFIPDAIRRGAFAIVSERFHPEANHMNLPQFVVSSTRAVLPKIARAAFGDPAQRLKLIGVTGTNGKTTTAFLIQHLLNLKKCTGLIGTIYCDDGQRKGPLTNTTPGPIELNQLFARMVEHGVSVCVMEVSSHALDQERVDGLIFSHTVFTNLTQDHLDYHRDMEHYYQAKRKLFIREPAPERSVVNCDDAYGVRLADELERNRVTSYGFQSHCDIRAEHVVAHLDAVEFDLVQRGERLHAEVPLGLTYNVSNILAAVAVTSEAGISCGEAIRRLQSFPGVPGRMEKIDEGQDFLVYVDYAHTPDALEQVLLSSTKACKNRLVCVFGCGGNRDRGKRPLMGRIAARYCALVILTSDNPRNEDPMEICQEMRQGINQERCRPEIVVEVDRERAIRRAITEARRGDLVFIFGKGHEDVQIIGDRKLPFRDQDIARSYSKRRCLPFKISPEFAAER